MIVTCARKTKDLIGDNRRPGLVSCQGKRLEKKRTCELTFEEEELKQVKGQGVEATHAKEAGI